MNKKVKWVGILSTAERNHIGLIRVRQNNVNSEVLGFEIIDGNGEPYDLKNRKVLFCTYFDRFAPVEQYAEVIENGKIIYIMNEHDMQKPVRINFAYFKIMDEEDNLVDTTQNFSYDIIPSIESSCMNSEPYIIRLEEVLDGFLQINTDAKKELEQIIIDFNQQVIDQQQNFELWFESIREILESVDPGGVILNELVDFRYSKTFDKRFNRIKDRGDFWDEEIQKQEIQINELKNHNTYLENQEKLPIETDIGWINRVISEMDRGTLVFASKKTYYLNSAITIDRSDVNIDFNQAFIAFQGDIDYLIKAKNFHNLKLKNILLTKVPETVGSFIEGTNGTGFQLINLFGVNLGLKDLGVFSGVHKSFIKEVYVTNSNDTLKGRGFVFNYCVNFDVENVMLSYFQIPFRWNATKDPVHGFMNEGFTLRGIKTLKSSVAFQIDMCTSLTASDIVLDFNQSFGVYNANGTNIRINNFWIGMQDNVRGTGIEIFKGFALSFKEGTIAGNWKAKDIQQAFYSNVDTNATFEDIYLIDINGGILAYPKINVKNISYFQNKQKPVAVAKKGNYQSTFQGIRSIDNPLAITNASVDIISVDSRNPDYYVISEGYVNSKGIATIKTLKRGAGVDLDHAVYSDGYNVTFTKGTFDPSYMQTIVRVSQVVKDVFMYDPEKDEWL